MAKRPCLDCGKPGTSTRCASCTSARDRARGSSTARGYGQAHRAAREVYARRIRAGELVLCWCCGLPIKQAERLHLDHTADRASYRGPSHDTCNLRLAGLASKKRYIT